MIQLPTNRLGTKQIQLTKRNVPLDQIIAVEGQNPLATGIETAGNVLGQALQKRAALRQQGEQLAALGKITGQEIPDNVPPELALQGLQTKATFSKLNSEGKKKPLGQPFVGADGNNYQYFYDEKTEKTTPELLDKGLPSSKGSGKDFYFVDSASRQMFDRNMHPISLAPEGATPKIISDPYAGSEFARRGALSEGSKLSVSDARDLINNDTLTELKAIKMTPGKIYGQIASSDAKNLYRNMYNAMSNLLYLKTGATANPSEIENQMIAYMPAANDSLDDMKKRLDMLERESALYQKPTRNLSPIASPKPVRLPESGTISLGDGFTYKVKKK